MVIRETAEKNAFNAIEYAVKVYSAADTKYKLNALAESWYTYLEAKAKEIDGKYDVVNNLTTLDESYGGYGAIVATRAKDIALSAHANFEAERQKHAAGVAAAK